MEADPTTPRLVDKDCIITSSDQSTSLHKHHFPTGQKPFALRELVRPVQERIDSEATLSMPNPAFEAFLTCVAKYNLERYTGCQGVVFSRKALPLVSCWTS
jgi:hypothetical protein